MARECPTNKLKISPLKCYKCGIQGNISRNRLKNNSGKKTTFCNYCEKPAHTYYYYRNRTRKEIKSRKETAENLTE